MNGHSGEAIPPPITSEPWFRDYYVSQGIEPPTTPPPTLSPQTIGELTAQAVVSPNQAVSNDIDKGAPERVVPRRTDAPREPTQREPPPVQRAPKAIPGIAAPPSFGFVSLQALYDRPEEEHEDVIEGLCPRGAISLLAAKPKVGKSTLKRVIAAAVQGGDPALGRETVQGLVMDLALEESGRAVADHYRRLGTQGDAAIILHIGPAPVNPLVALGDEMRRFKPIIVFVDPIQRFLRIKDMNDYAEVSSAFEPLAELAREHNSHIMLLHHLGKEVRGDALGDAILGSTAILASVDMAFIMLKEGEQRVLQTDGPQRFGIELPPTTLNYDIGTGLLTAGALLSIAEKRELQQRIVNALGDARLKMGDLAEATGVRRNDLYIAVNAMYAEGLLVREGEGKSGDPYLYSVRERDDLDRENREDREAVRRALGIEE